MPRLFSGLCPAEDPHDARANGYLNTGSRKTDSFVAFGTTRIMVEDMNDLLPSFALDEVERLRLRAMAVTELIESGIALKPERLPLGVVLHYGGSYTRKANQPRPFLAGRNHDDSERFRILSEAVWSTARPHCSKSIGPHGHYKKLEKQYVTSEYPSEACPGLTNFRRYGT